MKSEFDIERMHATERTKRILFEEKEITKRVLGSNKNYQLTKCMFILLMIIVVLSGTILVIINSKPSMQVTIVPAYTTSKPSKKFSLEDIKLDISSDKEVHIRSSH